MANVFSLSCGKLNFRYSTTTCRRGVDVISPYLRGMPPMAQNALVSNRECDSIEGKSLVSNRECKSEGIREC